MLRLQTDVVAERGRSNKWGNIPIIVGQMDAQTREGGLCRRYVHMCAHILNSGMFGWITVMCAHTLAGDYCDLCTHS